MFLLFLFDIITYGSDSMDDNYYLEIKRCKTNWLDDIFYGTKESKGLRNAVNAIKLVLFDDYSVVPDGVEINDKFEFISSKRDGRAKAKMLQRIDMIHILCKYALCSFGIKNKSFLIDDEIYIEHRNKKAVNEGFSNEYIVELIAYSLMKDIYGAYILVASNKFIEEQLFESFISERYIENKLADLDLFNGELTNEYVPYDIKMKYQEAYDTLDDIFLKIKKNDSNYII